MRRKDEQKNTEETSDEPKREKSLTDQWRDAEREAQKTERVAEAARDKANTIAATLAQELIDKHASACVELDGAKYAPKAGATRKMQDGNTKPPKYAFQLVRAKDKALVEI